MTNKTKRVFDKEFKINTMKLVSDKSKTIAELSRELGISVNTLHNWKNKYLKHQEYAFNEKAQKIQE